MKLTDYMTVTEAANDLSVTRQRVLRLIQTGKLKATKVGVVWLIPKRAVADRIASRTSVAN